MSRNTIITKGQHVFRYDPPEFTENGAPFMATLRIIEKDGVVEEKYQFLGDGFYFWDDNIRRAKKWGQSHCDGKYKILEVPLNLHGNDFLDLVGSRQDIENFLHIYNSMKKRVNSDSLGEFIYGMQQFNRDHPGTWPFRVVRALNVKSNAKSIPFGSVKNSEMLLNPEIIVCYYDKNDIDLQESHIML